MPRAQGGAATTQLELLRATKLVVDRNSALGYKVPTLTATIMDWTNWRVKPQDPISTAAISSVG